MSKICRIAERTDRRSSWKRMEVDRDRVKEGIQIMRNMLAEDERRWREGPSGFPLDVRNRVYRIY